jgi:hypothetical protein
LSYVVYVTQTTIIPPVDLTAVYDSVKVGDPNPTDAMIDKEPACTYVWLERPHLSAPVTRYCTRFAHAQGQHVAEGPNVVLAVKEL